MTPILLQRLHERSSGAGEEVLPAVVAAIGNAFFDATGVRLRQYPLTPAACWRRCRSEQPGPFADLDLALLMSPKAVLRCDRTK